MATTNVTDKDITDILDKNKSVLSIVYCHGSACSPCKAFAPSYLELSNELGYTAVFLKLDVDDGAGFARQYGVRSLPTTILFKNNKVIDVKIGVSTKEDFKKFILSNC